MSEPDWAAGLKRRLSEVIDPAIKMPKEVPALRLAPEPKVEKIPVTPRTISTLESVHQETFTLTEEWHTDDWDKVVAFAILRMTYGQYIKMMDGINASFKEVDAQHPGWNAEQVSHEALQVWAKKLSLG